DAFERAIGDAARDWEPDVIHAQHLWVTGYAASKTDVPTVETAHGTDLMGFRRYPDWRALALEGTHKAGAVIAISRQVSADAIALYHIPPARVRLILNGFDESVFHPMTVDRAEVLRGFGLTETSRAIVMFVGKLTAFKGVDVLLEAAAIYESALGDVMTVIVGDGELREQLRDQAADLQVKNVHFLGQHPQPQVARLLNAADVSVVPSRVEPFGLVAVEALACGTPVVATSAGGLPDFIDDRVGWLVEAGDSDQLADAVIEAVEGNAKAAKGPVASSFARKHFSWSQKVDEMISVYTEVLAG
ncbi:MAG: glycosyltransferase, partial [Anaerolineales bacterium]